ncbi:predicted protein, partial [Nematostella vectensis]
PPNPYIENNINKEITIRACIPPTPYIKKILIRKLPVGHGMYPPTPYIENIIIRKLPVGHVSPPPH